MPHPVSVLITGASRGIGLLTAKELAQRGHRVYASMRDPHGRNAENRRDLEQWAQDNKAKLTVIALDVTDESTIATAMKDINANGPLDCLINNAGIMPVGVSEAFTTEDFQRCLDVNLLGLANVTQAVLPGMRKQRSGLLIHVSSAAGRLALPFFGVYCASKWAVEGYAEALHYELADYGVQSVIIEPSGHGTDLVKTAPKPSNENILTSYGDLADSRERFLEMFKNMFAEGNAITDASNVARTIAKLIEMDGPRPIRTQIGQDMGVQAINEATAPIQASMIGTLKPVYASGA